MLSRTVYGRSVLAVGQNSRAAWLAGLNVDRTRFLTYVLSAILAGVCGILLSGFSRGAALNMGEEFLLASIATVVIGGASHFNDRWLQPLLFFAPLMFFVGWPGLQRHPRLHWLGWAAGVTALLSLTLLSLRPWYDGQRGHIGDQNLPIQGLAQAVREAGIAPAVVVVEPKHLAGSLRLGFPAARIDLDEARSLLPAQTVFILPLQSVLAHLLARLVLAGEHSLGNRRPHNLRNAEFFGCRNDLGLDHSV